MKQSKLDSKSIQWIKEDTKEFTKEFIRKSELVKNFYKELEPYRKRKDKEGYLTQKLKIKHPVFEFRKNKEDKREKQIRII